MPKIARTCLAVIVSLAAVALSSTPASGQTYTWKNTGATDWFTPGNWTGGVPTSSGTTYIDPPSNTIAFPTISSGSAITGTLEVGYSGFNLGGLTIQTGGQLQSTFGSLGELLNSNGGVTVNGSGSKWTITSGLYVGTRGVGSLSVQNGGQVASLQASVGVGVASRGNVFVSGTGSTWTNGGGITLGGFLDPTPGVSTLTVSNGGSLVNTAGSLLLHSSQATLTLDGGSITTQSFQHDSGTVKHYDGTLTVNGTGSNNFIWGSPDLIISGNTAAKNPLLVLNNAGAVNLTSTSVGDAANMQGQLTISGGTVLNDSTTGIIGNGTGSTGVATVTGSGSSWTTTGSLSVGKSGNGTLNVLNGGQVQSNIGRVGDSASGVGVVAVDGSGSKLTTVTSLNVGRFGNGTLTVTNGGLVQCDTGSIGTGAGSTGLLTVEGSGSKWTATSLSVGGSGNGTLNVTNGGHVQANDGFIALLAGSTGAATVDGTGSSWVTANTLTVGSLGTGTLNVQSGGTVQAGSVSVGSLGTLAGDGAVIGPVTVVSGGTLRAGVGGVGTLSLSNPLTLNSGATVSVAINNSSSAMSSNFLAITGGATINPGTKFFLDGTGATFNPTTTYHFQIASGAGDQSALNIANQSQFSGIGFTMSDYNFSVTGNSTGDVFVNFVPVPEPAAVLGVAVGAMGLGALSRRRLRKPSELTIVA